MIIIELLFILIFIIALIYIYNTIKIRNIEGLMSSLVICYIIIFYFTVSRWNLINDILKYKIW